MTAADSVREGRRERTLIAAVPRRDVQGADMRGELLPRRLVEPIGGDEPDDVAQVGDGGESGQQEDSCLC